MVPHGGFVIYCFKKKLIQVTTHVLCRKFENIVKYCDSLFYMSF